MGLYDWMTGKTAVCACRGPGTLHRSCPVSSMRVSRCCSFETCNFKGKAPSFPSQAAPASLVPPQVLILGGLDATLRRGEQLDGAQQLRRWQEGEGALLSSLRTGPIPVLEETWWEEQALWEWSLPPWPQAAACAHLGLPVAAVLRFAAEGNNAGDAMELAAAAADALGLGLEPQALCAPSSWQQVFGVPLS